VARQVQVHLHHILRVIRADAKTRVSIVVTIAGCGEAFARAAHESQWLLLLMCALGWAVQLKES
jgi:hypothetical protein